ncbi:hypothetical protein BJX61DRAFT_536431 [Aspergillus egyptiacus]|nr:hypothetical protein BJX61DRAFT_536431 [Aspergillus egyptiacus]
MNKSSRKGVIITPGHYPNSASHKQQAGAKQSHLSMQQEARNTEGRNLWRLDVQLRHQAVQFVSAGNLEPAENIRPKATDEEPLEGEQGLMLQEECGSATNTAASGNLSAASINITRITPRPSSPNRTTYTPEDSSEDEIVFRGRRKGLDTISTSAEGVVDSRSTAQLNGERVEVPDSAGSASSRDGSLSYISINKCGGPSRRAKLSDEDEILADYIANIDDDDYSEDEGSCSSTKEHPIESHAHTIARTGTIALDDLTPYSDNEDIETDCCEALRAVDFKDETPYNPTAYQLNSTETEGSIFAPATAFADALELDPYYGFDIMDFRRPSVSKHKKTKLPHFDMDTLDAELQTELLNTWNNDRLRKKSKKREREEFRAQGLLGRRKNDPDLKSKYADGISFEDLKSEIRLFLLSSKNSLSLPPMTKHRRMLIHDMAHALNLTSQSRGKGSSRFPVLSKTTRTPQYTQKSISRTDRILSRERFSARALKAWDKSGGRSVKGKRNHSSVSYMDGDVVGASAPEIGAENKGRAMLERMGWSTGTALGAIHNKGILLPVRHVVKNSKAGLG